MTTQFKHIDAATHRKLIDALLLALIDPPKYAGICGIYHQVLGPKPENFMMLEEATDWFMDAFERWPDSAGRGYPVPPPENWPVPSPGAILQEYGATVPPLLQKHLRNPELRDKPAFRAYWSLPKWEGEYGQSRFNLCAWLAKELQECTPCAAS